MAQSELHEVSPQRPAPPESPELAQPRPEVQVVATRSLLGAACESADELGGQEPPERDVSVGQRARRIAEAAARPNGRRPDGPPRWQVDGDAGCEQCGEAGPE